LNKAESSSLGWARRRGLWRAISRTKRFYLVMITLGSKRRTSKTPFI